MKIPKSFIYSGKVWKIYLEKDLHHDDGTKCDGLADLDLREIFLDKSLPKAKKEFVLMHELFHVVMHESRVPPNVLLTEDIEDILAEAFAELMTNCFKVRFK